MRHQSSTIFPMVAQQSCFTKLYSASLSWVKHGSPTAEIGERYPCRAHPFQIFWGVFQNGCGPLSFPPRPPPPRRGMFPGGAVTPQSPPLLLLVASGGKEWVVGWVRDLIHGRDSFSSSSAAASVAFGLNLVNGMSPTPEKKKTPLSVHKRGRGEGGGKE